MTARKKLQDEVDPGLTLEDLFADVLTFTMQWKGKPLEVSWAPDRYTSAIEERVQEILHGDLDEDVDDGMSEDKVDELRRATRERHDIQATREMLTNVLVGWSLKSKDGHPIPTTDESLKTLPRGFLMAVFGALSENAGPKEPTESPSTDT